MYRLINRVFRIYVWISWNPEGIRDVILYGTDGDVMHVNNVVAYCDMPFTADIVGDITVTKVLRSLLGVFMEKHLVQHE